MAKLIIDWIDILRTNYATALEDRVREAYLAAYSVLEKAYTERKAKCEEDISGAADEEAYLTLCSDLSYEKDRWDEQTQAMAAMALTLIASSNKSFLDQMKGMFAKSHPADPSKYRGSILDKQITEYKARFGVDLGSIDAFDTIREVELARHCCVHSEGQLTDDYREQTKQRFVGGHGYIDINPDILNEILSDLAKFARGLSAEMKTVRATNKS